MYLSTYHLILAVIIEVGQMRLPALRFTFCLDLTLLAPHDPMVTLREGSV